MFPYAVDNPAPRKPGPVAALIAANAAFFLAEQAAPETYALAFIPAKHSAFTWLTSQFLHADFLHLAGNMYALWLFGPEIAACLGPWFLPFYLAGGAAAAALHSLSDPHSNIPVIGASGAICGLIGAYAVVFPRARLKFLGRISYTLSALVFGALYVLLQGISALLSPLETAGTAHWAHLGGLLFGISVGPFLPAEPRERGKDGERAAAVRAALAAEDEGRAARLFRSAVEHDASFEMDSSDEQLSAANALYRAGHARLAQAALDRLVNRWPDEPAAARACLMLGDLEYGLFKDHARALAHYVAAARHPAADARTRKDADAGRAASRAALDRNMPELAAPDAACAVLFEGEPPLSDEQAAAAAAVLGPGSGTSTGFLARAVIARAAEKAAAELERAGVPAVVVPEPRLLRLHSPLVVEFLSLDEPGPGLDRGKTSGFAWDDLLLAAVTWLKRVEYEQELPDILAVEVEGEARKLRGVDRAFARLDLVARDGRRARWESPLDTSTLRGLLNGIEVRVPNAHFEWGALGLLEGREPAACSFDDPAAADDYVFWQTQLARLKDAPPRRSSRS